MANPNSSARYGSPFMSQYRWSALTVGGSARQRPEQGGQPFAEYRPRRS